MSFRQVNKKTGNRLRQQLADDVTREPVEAEDKGRGYEVAKNTFILIDDDELDAIAIESTQTIEIDHFVPRTQIDERYFESPYYIVPNDQVGQEAFAVIREAMRGKGMVALGRASLGACFAVGLVPSIPQGRPTVSASRKSADAILPSATFREVIASGAVPVIRLTEVFRQAAQAGGRGPWW